MSVTGNGGGQRQAAKCLGSSLDPVSSEQDRLEQAVGFTFTSEPGVSGLL